VGPDLSAPSITTPAHTVRQRATTFCIVIKLYEGTFFQSRPHPSRASSFVMQMLMHDMFVIVNIVAGWLVYCCLTALSAQTGYIVL